MTQKYLEPSKKTRFSQRANRRVLDDAIDVSGTTNFGRYRDDNCSSVRYYSCSAPQPRNRKERAVIIGRWRVRVLSLNWPRHSTVSTTQNHHIKTSPDVIAAMKQFSEALLCSTCAPHETREGKSSVH